MSHASEWLETALLTDFPGDAEFREGDNPNHVIVSWTVDNPSGSRRCNAPFVIVVDDNIFGTLDAASERREVEIEARIREIVTRQRMYYDENGPVAVTHAFEVRLDNGDL